MVSCVIVLMGVLFLFDPIYINVAWAWQINDYM